MLRKIGERCVAAVYVQQGARGCGGVAFLEGFTERRAGEFAVGLGDVEQEAHDGPVSILEFIADQDGETAFGDVIGISGEPRDGHDEEAAVGGGQTHSVEEETFEVGGLRGGGDIERCAEACPTGGHIFLCRRFELCCNCLHHVLFQFLRI